MLSTIESVNSAVNNFIWGVPAMIALLSRALLKYPDRLPSDRENFRMR